jgi:hypothetical protein
VPSSRLPCPSRVAPEQDGVRPRNSALAATHSSVSTFRGVRPLFGVIGEPRRARSWLTFSATERPSSDARSEDWVAGGPSGVCEKLAPATVCQQRGASRQWRRSVHSAGPPQASSSWLTEQLLKHGRAHGAVKLAGYAAKYVSDELLAKILEEAARSERKETDEPAMFQYNIEQIFERLDKSGTVDPERVARLEWIYLQVLEHSNRPPVTLHRQLASRPEFFVEVLSTIYRAGNEEPDQQKGENRESKAALASHAWTLLHSWNLLPGFSEGNVDGAALEEWVSEARRLSHEAGRADIGDEQIGQMLAWAPADVDGTWPCEAVRDVIEIARSRHLETGVYIGVKNRRGTTSRGVTDGGEQERDLAKQYRDHAEAVRFEWPRTAAALGRIAESYEAEAKEHDDDAERYQW